MRQVMCSCSHLVICALEMKLGFNIPWVMNFALQAQADRYTAQQKEEFYKTALQELTLFKSRTNAALLQVPIPCAFEFYMSCLHGRTHDFNSCG